MDGDAVSGVCITCGKEIEGGWRHTDGVTYRHLCRPIPTTSVDKLKAVCRSALREIDSDYGRLDIVASQLRSVLADEEPEPTLPERIGRAVLDRFREELRCGDSISGTALSGVVEAAYSEGTVTR